MRRPAVRQWFSRIHRHQLAFGSELAQVNLQRMTLLAVVVIPISLIHVISFWRFEPASANEAQWRLGIISFHTTLIILVTALCATIRLTPSSAIRDRIISAAGLTCVLASGIVVTVVDQQVTAAVTPFVIACMLAGTVFLLSPLQALLAYGSALALYLISLDVWQTDPIAVMSSRMNGFTAAGLAFALSFILWSQAIHSRRQHHVIQTQQQNLEQANTRLTTLAAIDELTGLANRRILTLLLEQELAAIERHSKPACLLILDIDHFKTINDQHGHVEGDNVLRQFAQLMKTSVRASDHVSRWGGEEFAILLRNADVETARTVAEGLRRRIGAHSFVLNGATVTLTASMGITELDPAEPDALMQAYQRADQMLYEAKGAGRNQIRAA